VIECTNRIASDDDGAMSLTAAAARISSAQYFTHIFARLFHAEHHQHLRHYALISLAQVQAVKAVAVHWVENVEPAWFRVEVFHGSGLGVEGLIVDGLEV